MLHLVDHNPIPQIWDLIVSPDAATESSVICEFAGDVPLDANDTLCLFAHYATTGRIEPYVRYHLKALKELGVSTIFISTDENLTEDAAGPIKDHVSVILVRKNIGLDFGSWYEGLRRAGDVTRFRRLILANDSIYGPLFDLKPVFADMEARGYDAWGITESLQIRWHLQSYFLVLNNPVLGSAPFRRFWERLRFFRNKSNVIQFYEIGFSRMLLHAGFRLSAYCRLNDLIHPYRGEKKESEAMRGDGPKLGRFIRKWINPTFYYRRRLIVWARCPYLKVRAADRYWTQDDWPSVLKVHTDYDATLIRKHQGAESRLKTARASEPQMPNKHE